jgi:hypothetical protein
MVEHSDIHPPPDDQSDVDKFAGLADAPVTALGLSSRDADALGQALGVKTVRELRTANMSDEPRRSCTWRTSRTHGQLLPHSGIGQVPVG